MSREKFLTAIRKNPADDTARLVLADWLEENARIAHWPKLIRLQIQQTGKKKEAWECVTEAARDMGLDRFGDLRRGPYRAGGVPYVNVRGSARFWVSFERGLPHTLGYGDTLDQFVTDAAELFVWPIQEVHYTLRPATDDGFVNGPFAGLNTYDWWDDEYAWAEDGDDVAPDDDGIVPSRLFREMCRRHAKDAGAWAGSTVAPVGPEFIEFTGLAAAYDALTDTCIAYGRKAYRAAYGPKPAKKPRKKVR